MYRKVINLCVRFIYASEMQKNHKFIVPYVTMHKTLERINENRMNLSRGQF